MKQQFSRRRNALLSGSRGPIVLGLLGVVILLALVRAFFPGALAALASPLWGAGSMLSAGVGNAGTFLGSKEEIAFERDVAWSERAALAARNATLAARVADLERLLGERTEPEKGILASVLSRPPVSPYDVLVVDAGSAVGVREGAQAHAAGGVPVGTIESVTGGSARILLYSSPGRETEAWVGESRIPVTLVGQGAGAFSASVAREAGLVDGDLVYLPGSGALATGSIIGVEQSPSSPRSTVHVRPLLNPFSITWVSIAP